MERIAYTVAQAADAVGLSKFVLYKAIKQGALIATQPYPNAKFMITPEDLKAWIKAQPAAANLTRHLHTNAAA